MDNNAVEAHCRAQAEVEAAVTLGKEAGLAQYGAGLAQLAGGKSDGGANRAAVRTCSLEEQRDPMGRIPTTVPV